MKGRDSRGRFIKDGVPWNKRLAPLAPLAPPVGITGGGVMSRERVLVTCPACGQRVEAIAWDGRVKGYCAVAGHYVNFPVEILTAETKAKISAANKGKRRTADTKAKIAVAHRGKHPTAETKAKISATLKRLSREQRPGGS